jgi:hypothetical protein
MARRADRRDVAASGVGEPPRRSVLATTPDQGRIDHAKDWASRFLRVVDAMLSPERVIT